VKIGDQKNSVFPHFFIYLTFCLTIESLFYAEEGMSSVLQIWPETWNENEHTYTIWSPLLVLIVNC